MTLSLHAQVVEGAGSGSLGLRLAVLEQVENNLDGLVKLLVDAIKLLDWVVVDEDVGVNAVVLDNPVAAGVVVGEEGHADVGAVHIGQ